MLRRTIMPKRNPEHRPARIFPMSDEQHERLKALAIRKGVSMAQYCEDLIQEGFLVKYPPRLRNRNINMSDSTWEQLRQMGKEMGLSGAATLRGAIEHKWGNYD